MGSKKTPLEKLAYFLSANPYILAAGWLFTVVGGFITVFTVNTILGIVIMILFGIFLLRVPKYAPIENDPIPEQFPSKFVPSEPLTLYSIIPPAIDLVGRDNDIQAIHNLLKQNNIVSIHADGGVGKTAVAAKIANEIKDEMISGKSPYQHIAWITSSGNLEADLTGINIPSVVAAKTLEEKKQALLAFFASTSTFLIIDNMDIPPSKEEKWLLNTIAGKVKILITTRAEISGSKPYSLSELDPDSALLLAYRYYKRDKEITIDQIKKRDDVSFAEQIVTATGKNALFIELIGKMAYSEKKNLRELWNLLKDNVFGKDSAHSISTEHAESHGEKEGKLLTQIQKLYQLSTLSDKQKEIMSFIALFPPERSIFFDVFKWAGFEDDEEDNLRTLQDRGWIERGENGYLIHTIVKGSVQLQSGKGRFDEDRYENLILELIDFDQYIPEGTIYTKVRERIVVPETVCRLLTDKGSKKENTTCLYNNISVVYYTQGNYEKALEYLEKALTNSEKVLGPEHPDAAAMYHNIAQIYSTQGNYEKALEYYEKALAIREKVLGLEHPDTATTYNNIAGVYFDQGNYKKTLEYYEKALAIREKVLGPEHPSTATTYNNIAGVYCEQGNYKKALEYYEKDRVICEKVLGPEHPSTATTYHNIAGVYCEQGNYKEALEYYEKALAINETVLGKEHLSTATTYNNIALMYSNQENYEKALEYYEKALVIVEEVLGLEHPSTATTYNNIAGVYFDQGNYKKTLEYCEKALAIKEKVLGPEHPSTATTYNNIADVYYAQDNYRDALNYCKKALAIQEKVLEPDHPTTSKTFNDMGCIYYSLGNYEKAQEFFEKSIIISNKKLGPEHLYTKITRENLEATKNAITRNESHGETILHGKDCRATGEETARELSIGLKSIIEFDEGGNVETDSVAVEKSRNDYKTD